MVTIISKVILKQICNHAVASYPEEACGLLFGQKDEDRKFVRAFRQAQNAAEGSRQNRYLIAPIDLLGAENFSRVQGWEVLGVFHSHPDHPARPSEFDREHAILHYSYIILSVTRGRVGEATCWTLHDWGSPLASDELLVSD